jgi:hypothetical protein
MELPMSIISPQPGKPVEPDENQPGKQQTRTMDKDLPKVHETTGVEGGSSSDQGGAHG